MRFSKKNPLVGLVAILIALTPAHAELSSKRYTFSKNKVLPLSVTVGEVEVRSILFEFPSSILGFRGSNRAKVKVVNGGSETVRIGLGIALFDHADNLVGVSSGGNKGVRLKPGAEVDYSLPFHFLTDNVENAASFFLSIETS